MPRVCQKAGHRGTCPKKPGPSKREQGPDNASLGTAKSFTPVVVDLRTQIMSTVDSTTSWNSFNRSVSPESIFSSPLLFGAHDNLPEVPFQLHDNDGSRYMGSDDDAIRLTEMEKDVREPHLWKGPGEVAQALATRVGTPSSAPVSACPTGIRPHELYHFKDGNIKFQVCLSVPRPSIAQAKLPDRGNLIQCPSLFL